MDRKNQGRALRGAAQKLGGQAPGVANGLNQNGSGKYARVSVKGLKKARLGANPEIRQNEDA